MAKILIFTSKTGGGHVSLAEALRDRLQTRHEIEILDPQPAIIHWHYRLLSRHALWLWSAEFKSSDSPGRALAAHRLFNALFGRSLGRILQERQPNLVMTTYPFLTYEVVEAMRRNRQRVPFVILFADPNGVHHSWLTVRDAEATLAPTRETYQQALQNGFEPQRTHLSGWPVRGQFYHQPADVRQRVLQQLGLPQQPFTAFLQGGGEGAAHFAATVENILAIPGVQIILAAGTNQALYERFQGQDRIRPLSFTKEIAQYMAAADVVIGKAGPNMLFETVTLGKPFIATAYIPGQEEVNLEYIQRHRLGWVALQAEEQRALVSSLVQQTEKLQAMDASVAEYQNWNNRAVETIGPITEALIQ